MANIKTSNKKIYISKALKEKLSILRTYSCTVIDAPMGYGKTSVLRHYFKALDYYDLWVNGDPSKELFWKNLCDAVEVTDPDFATQLTDLKFPSTETDVSNFISIVRRVKAPVKTVIIIDDYNLIASEITDKIFVSLAKSLLNNLKIILVSRTFSSENILNLVLRDEIGSIHKDDFKYKPADIVSYFQLNELQINHEEANEIYDYSDGWPFFIKLQMINYATSRDFYAVENIDAFIKNSIWHGLTENERYFFVTVCIFDEFSLPQAASLTNTNILEAEAILDNNEFVDYHIDRMTYILNPLFRKYLLKIFANIPPDVHRRITIEAGKLYEQNKHIFSAIYCFHTVKDFDSIYAINPQMQDICNYVTHEHKPVFLDIASNYWLAKKSGHYQFAIVLSFILFLYNERQEMKTLISFIANDIEKDDTLSDRNRSKLMAELSYASAYCEYNNYIKINDCFIKAAEFSNEPLTLIAGQIPISLGVPSVLSLYYNRCGLLDLALSTVEQCAPDYYKLTNFHGKGFESLMRAEVLYNRGEFEGAETICHKAMYQAESRNQNSICLCALLLLARLAICEGNYDAFNEYIRSIEKKTVNKSYSNIDLHKMIELSKSFLYATINDKSKISEWLKDDKQMENNTNFITLNYASIIYGKFLILDEQYYHFLGISGQFLGLTSECSNILPEIYTYIYIAIANKEANEMQKAHKFLIEAFALAANDNIYMPFVENYGHIEELVEELSFNINNNPYSAFIRAINRFVRNYSKGLRAIQKSNLYSANFGLTARETDVARLAAQRLSNKEISEMLYIAESTVKSNMKTIFNKLSINSRSDLKKFFD